MSAERQQEGSGVAPVARALVVVDPLVDFCPGGSLAVPGGDEVMGVINRLGSGGDYAEVVLVQERHPAGHVSFASAHGAEPFTRVRLAEGREQDLWPDHCVEGSPGCEPHPALDGGIFTHTLHKGGNATVDSYSGFADDAGQPTGLADYLRDRGVGAVDVAGLATDYCVKATAVDAAREGFATRVLLEACRGVGLAPEDIPAAVEAMRAAGVEVVEQ